MGSTGPGHSRRPEIGCTLENMKTKKRRTAPHGTTASNRAVMGHDAAPVASPTALPGEEIAAPRTVGPETYEVSMEFVATVQSANPAQIPWLDEIRRDQQLNDSFSEVI